MKTKIAEKNHLREATKKVGEPPEEPEERKEEPEERKEEPEERKEEMPPTEPAQPPPTPPAPAAPVVGQNRMLWPGLPVQYNGGVCPNCGSSRNVIEKTGAGELTTMGRARILRKHRCENCGWFFRTCQVVNAVDVPHIRMEKTPAS